jgi:hypothetical protein
MCHALITHTHPFAFLNQFFTLHLEILHLALSSLVYAPPAASDVVLCP